MTTEEWRRAPLVWRRIPTFFLEWFYALWGLRITGRENIPLEGPLIVSANHVGYTDGPLLAAVFRGRRYLRGLGKAELFRIPVLGHFLLRNGSIPLDRKGDVNAMRAAIEALRGGACLLVMPEGTRSRDGRRGPAKAGVGFLAAHTGAAVLPVRLIGVDRYPFGRLEARVGVPMRFEGPVNDREAYRRFGEAVLDRVFEL